MKNILGTLIMAGSAGVAQADMVTRTVDYQIDGDSFKQMRMFFDETLAGGTISSQPERNKP